MMPSLSLAMVDGHWHSDFPVPDFSAMTEVKVHFATPPPIIPNSDNGN